MSFWFIGDEEHNDPRFTTSTLGLYTRAGSWCMSQVRYRPSNEIPPEWFVPDSQVKAWCGSVRPANSLVPAGLWYRARGGYGFAWIRDENTADALRAKRASGLRKWERHQARKKAEEQPRSGVHLHAIAEENLA
jgi:hypothetical protein